MLTCPCHSLLSSSFLVTTKTVYAWLRAVVTGYYRYWKEQCFDKRKAEISKAVNSLAPQVRELITRPKQGDDDDQQAEGVTTICPLANYEQFNHFVDFTWTIRIKKISIHHYTDVHVDQRNGTLVPFTPHQRQPSQPKAQKKPPPAPAPAHLPEPVQSAAQPWACVFGDSGSRRTSAPDHGLCDTMATATAPPWQGAFSPIAGKKRRLSDNMRTGSPQAVDTDEDHVLGASRPSSAPNPRRRNMQNTIISHLEKKAEGAVKGKEQLRRQLLQQQQAHEEREEEWANEIRRLESKTRRLQGENQNLQEIANERDKQLHEGKQLVQRLTAELTRAQEGKQSDDATTAAATAAAAAAATSDAHWRRQVEKLEAEKANIQEQRQRDAAAAAASDARWQKEVKMLREQLQSSEDQIIALQEEFTNAASNGQQCNEDNVYQHFRQEDLDI